MMSRSTRRMGSGWRSDRRLGPGWRAWRSAGRAGLESDKFRLMVFDRETKTIRDLMPKFDGWVDEFAWDGGSRLLFTSPVEGEEWILGTNAGTNGDRQVFLSRKGGGYSSLADRSEEHTSELQ